MAKIMFTARIEQEEEDLLKSLGGGDRTAGFRVLLGRAKAETVKRPVAGVARPRDILPTHPVAKPVARAAAPAPVAPPRRAGFIGRR